MVADWNAECSHEAPMLIVPWADPAGGARFYDLRDNPYDIAELPEAEAYPALARALRALNASRSPLLTAKCDAWTLSRPVDTDALNTLESELMLEDNAALFAVGCYIDLLWRERSIFASAHQQQDRLDRIVRRAARLAHPEATMECVLRPAVVDLGAALEGFSVSLYVTAVGPEPEIARRRWELALEDVVALLRARDLELPRGSATIDIGSPTGPPLGE